MSASEAKKPPRFCQRSVPFQVASVDGDGFTLEGYGSVFNQRTEINNFYEGHFEEQFKPGSFKRTLNSRTPVMQFDHGHDPRTGTLPIGVIEEIREDSNGLYVRSRLFDNDLVAPIRHAIAAGVVDGMSTSFRVLQDSWQKADRAGGLEIRTVEEVELYELGPVVFPQYVGTSVGVRSRMAVLSREERIRLLDELLSEEASPRAKAQETSPSTPHAEEAREEKKETTRRKDPAKRRHSKPSKQVEPASWYLPPVNKN